MKTRAEIRNCLTGPIASFRTPFLKNGDIDEEGARRYIDFALAAGSPTVLITLGDSLFHLLTDDEVASLTRLVVDHVGGRAMVVAADRGWWTGKAVAFARFARDVGADVLMIKPPESGPSATPDTYADHYAAIAREMPVMLVTAPFIPRGAAFGLATVKQALERRADIVAIKDDFCGEFGRKLSSLAHEQLAVFAGGQKQNHLNALPYGCDGYLSTFITFKPEVTHRYWRAVQCGDLDSATAVVRELDMPLFEFIASFPGGFDAALHGIYELSGLYGRWRRRPFHSLTDAELDRLRQWLCDKSLL